jgi:cardiolipin synthase
VHHLPNLITLLRCVLIVPTGWALLDGAAMLAFTLFLLAGLSDGLDGWLARRFSWQSRLGAIADPLADKFMVAVLYVILAVLGGLPSWLAALVIGRDLVIVAGALAYHFLIARLELAPTRLGKLNTAAHVFFVGLVLASRTESPLAALDVLVAPGVWIIALLTILSGAHYVWTWARLASAARDATRD